jgi:hypothetical protein
VGKYFAESADLDGMGSTFSTSARIRNIGEGKEGDNLSMKAVCTAFTI